MSTQPLTLQEYLLTQKIDITKRTPGVLESDDALVKASTAWETNQEGIRLVIEGRMQKIRDELILTCTPYEVLEFRRVLLELGSVLEDFEKFKEEASRRAILKGKEKEEQATTVEAPVEETPEEDSSSV